MKALDTSVAMPALLEGHPDHVALAQIGGDGRVLPAHAALETYSVLTRLHAGRMSPAAAADAIDKTFVAVIPFPAEDQAALLATLAAAGVSGGAVYDALVGLTARYHGATLLTRDPARRGYLHRTRRRRRVVRLSAASRSRYLARMRLSAPPARNQSMCSGDIVCRPVNSSVVPS